MSEKESVESTSDQGGNDSSATTPSAGPFEGAESGFKAITSQEDLNKVIDERLKRERAKFSDYKDLKAKAGRLDEIEAANKSEIEKANDAKSAAERERDEARAEALRLRVATKYGVSDEDADLFLTGTDEETLTRQAERLAGREADRKRKGNYVPGEGANPPAKRTGSTAEQFADVMGDALSR